MCWMIHSALLGSADEKQADRLKNELELLNGRHGCRIVLGTKHDLKMALLSDNWDYRVTRGYCDCDSPIGAHDANAPEVQDFAALIAEVCALPAAKRLSFCKTWAGERNRREIDVKLSETDLPRLLADLEPNTLYTLYCKS